MARSKCPGLCALVRILVLFSPVYYSERPGIYFSPHTVALTLGLGHNRAALNKKLLSRSRVLKSKVGELDASLGILSCGMLAPPYIPSVTAPTAPIPVGTGISTKEISFTFSYNFNLTNVL